MVMNDIEKQQDLRESLLDNSIGKQQQQQQQKKEGIATTTTDNNNKNNNKNNNNNDDDDDNSNSYFTYHQIKVGFYFLLWWTLNVAYNVYNKRTLNQFGLPWTVALVQMFGGIPYILLLWGTKMRKVPHPTREDLLKMAPIAFCHLSTHIGAVLSMGAGAVSFTHIIKASESVFSSLFAGIFMGTFFSWQVYVTLLPIIFGVAYASCTGDIGFTALGFSAAMMSNTFSALRGVVAKKIMGKESFTYEQNMDATNFFGILTILAFFMLLPISICLEGSQISTEWNKRYIDKNDVNQDDEDEFYNDMQLLFELFASAIFYYMYNEVAFIVLDNVHPVTHAVGNTVKRVVIIVSAIYVFNTPMSIQGWIGSGIAVMGTLCYSFAAKKWKKTYRCECQEN